MFFEAAAVYAAISKLIVPSLSTQLQAFVAQRGLGQIADLVVGKFKSQAAMSDHGLQFSGNHDLARGVVLSWCRATRQVLKQTLLDFPPAKQRSDDQQRGYADVKDANDKIRIELKRLEKNALRRGVDLMDSSILKYVTIVLDGIGTYVAEDGFVSADERDAVAQSIQDAFADVTCRICSPRQSDAFYDEPQNQIPAEICEVAHQSLPSTRRTLDQRGFGELVLAAMTDLIKGTEYPELKSALDLRQEVGATAERAKTQREFETWSREFLLSMEHMGEQTTKQMSELLRKLAVDMHASLSTAMDGLREDLQDCLVDQAKDLKAHFEPKLNEIVSVKSIVQINQERLDHIQGKLESLQIQSDKVFDAVDAQRRGAVSWPFLFTSDRIDTIKGFNYRWAIDDFVGHESELRRIERILLDAKSSDGKSKPFAWAALCGPAGSGKSRLAAQMLLRLNPQDGWKGGLLNRQATNATFARHLVETQQSPLFLIIDYAAARSDLVDFLSAIAERPLAAKSSDASDQTTGLKYPIRVLLVERNQTDPMFARLREDDGQIWACSASDHPIMVDTLQTNALLRIMRHRAKAEGVDWEDAELERMLKIYDSKRLTPLGAAIVGDQINRGAFVKADLSHSTDNDMRYEMFGKLIDEERLHWKRRCKAYGERWESLLRYHTNLAALSTFVQGITFDDLEDLMENSEAKAARYLGRHEDRRSDVQQLISGQDHNEANDYGDVTYSPMQPDLLAERFVMGIANTDANKGAEKSFAQWLRKTAWQMEPNRAAVFARMCFQDYPSQTVAQNFLLPDEKTTAALEPDAMARFVRNLTSDFSSLYQHGFPSGKEMHFAAKIAGLITDDLIEAAKQNAGVNENISSAVYQIATICGKIINPVIKHEHIAEEVRDEEKLLSRVKLQDVWKNADAANSTDSEAARTSKEEDSSSDSLDDEAREKYAEESQGILATMYRIASSLLEHPEAMTPETFARVAYVEATYIACFLFSRDRGGSTVDPAVFSPKEIDEEELHRLMDETVGVIDGKRSPHEILQAVRRTTALSYASPNETAAKRSEFYRFLSAAKTAPLDWDTHQGFIRSFYSTIRNLAYQESLEPNGALDELCELMRETTFDAEAMEEETLGDTIKTWHQLIVEAVKMDANREHSLLEDFYTDTVGQHPRMYQLHRNTLLQIADSLCRDARTRSPDRIAFAWEKLEKTVGDQPWEKESRKLRAFGPYVYFSLTESAVSSQRIRDLLDHLGDFATAPDVSRDEMVKTSLSGPIHWYPTRTGNLEHPIQSNGLDAIVRLWEDAGDQNELSQRLDDAIARIATELAMQSSFALCGEFLQRMWTFGEEHDVLGPLCRRGVYLAISVLALRPRAISDSNLTEQFLQIVLSGRELTEQDSVSRARAAAIRSLLCSPSSSVTVEQLIQ